MTAKKLTATYTEPELRERLKEKITAGTRGGKAGQWSARKAQLLKAEYEKAGGGYKGKKTAAQKHLSEWSGQNWKTSDDKPAGREELVLHLHRFDDHELLSGADPITHGHGHGDHHARNHGTDFGGAVGRPCGRTSPRSGTERRPRRRFEVDHHPPAVHQHLTPHDACIPRLRR